MMIAIFYILVSALIMFVYEPKTTFGNFFDALYWATTALTTVGYGDVFPHTDVGKLISMISSLFGVAVMLEPAAGLLVAFATNFYQAAMIYGSSSLVYYATSAMAALCIGVLIRKNGIICRKQYIKAITCYFVCATLIATLLTLWRTNGIADSAWERHYISMAMDAGMPSALACLFGTAVLKFFDSLLMLIVLPILQILTPKKYQNYELKQIVSWKHPYFKKDHEEENS